jgi:hypothetical protein
MALGSITLDLYVYTGTVGDYTASNLKYTINKDVIVNQSNIVLEIGELTRDFLTVTFNNDYVSQTVWATAIVRYKDENQTPFILRKVLTQSFLQTHLFLVMWFTT